MLPAKCTSKRYRRLPQVTARRPFQPSSDCFCRPRFRDGPCHNLYEGGMAMLTLRQMRTEPALNVRHGVRLWFGESPFCS